MFCASHLVLRATAVVCILGACDPGSTTGPFLQPDVRPIVFVRLDNGWSLFGLVESLRAQGRGAEAQKARKQYKKAWNRADVQPDLAWF